MLSEAGGRPNWPRFVELLLHHTGDCSLDWLSVHNIMWRKSVIKQTNRQKIIIMPGLSQSLTSLVMQINQRNYPKRSCWPTPILTNNNLTNFSSDQIPGQEVNDVLFLTCQSCHVWSNVEFITDKECQTERPHLPTSQHLQLWRNYSPRWFSCRLCSQLCGLSTGLTVRHVWGWSPPNNSTSTRYWGGFLSVDTATHISQLTTVQVGGWDSQMLTTWN